MLLQYVLRCVVIDYCYGVILSKKNLFVKKFCSNRVSP